MGAISVLLSRAGPPDPDTTRRMLAASPHRGERFEAETIGQVAMGICYDPDWPMASLAADGHHVVVFSGALDNDADLRRELRREGAGEPAASTPAATVLAAFRRWAEDAVPRLRGSFAGAVSDGGRVWCFRDHFGARPLFYHDGPDAFLAATEVKQVLAGASIRPEPDLDYLHGVLFGGLAGSTAYRGVERIPKQSIAETGLRSGVGFRTYWDPSRCVETANLGFEEALEGTREHLERAVRRMLTGRDVILLSGGLDSPVLAAMAVRAEGPSRPVRALTAVYPEYPSVDELEWTRMAADHVGMPLHQFVAEAGSLDAVERWVEILDGPADVVSIPESAEAYAAARALGARTVFTGEIAEILFESRAYLLDHLISHGRLRAAGQVLAELRRKGRSWPKIARRAVGAVVAPRILASYLDRRTRPPRGLPAWVDGGQFDRGDREWPLWGVNPRRRWRMMQTAAFRGPGIAFEADEICAATVGVDSRRPFADVDLWEFVLSLPAEVKFPGRRTKPLLREAMRGILPDALIDRADKTYFDEYHLAKADYPTLRRLLVDVRSRLEGIDYELLRDRLEREEMGTFELQWARNVARIHAFLNRWA